VLGAAGELRPATLSAVGRFIVLEGAEAVGKSTQAARLAKDMGAVLTREPGGTAVGEALRRMLLDPVVASPGLRAEALLMLAARAQHVEEVIGPALRSGRDVVCDRFSGSTLAYQGYGRGLDLGELAWLDRWATGGLAPDLVLLLDVPVDMARARRPGPGRSDRIEGEDEAFFDLVRAGFRQLAAGDPLHWRLVDASGTVEEVAEAVRDAVAAPAGRGA